MAFAALLNSMEKLTNVL